MRLLKQLSEAMGVSGAEQDVRPLILGQIERHVDDLQTDSMGNIIATQKGTGRGDRLKVMLDAHMDEVGLMVTGYNGDGMLKVAAIGSLDDRILPGKRVNVGPKGMQGVIGVKPIHLVESVSMIKLDSLAVDIGAANKEAAEGRAPLGTRIGFESTFADLGGVVRGKAFDDRAGCAELIHVLQGGPYPVDVIAAFTAQEEIGARGAQIAAHRIDPDLVFVLETTTANDLPAEDDQDVTPVTELGKGPALSVMDRGVIYDRRLNDFLVDTAAALGLPVQFKQAATGGTDGGGIITQRAGIPAAAISLPCRYLHSPNMLLDKRDYRNAIRLLEGALGRLDRTVLAR